MYGLNERELEIIKEVANRLDIKKILLFGSRAKGNYKKGSDIDLAIVGNERKFSYYLNEETNLPHFLLRWCCLKIVSLKKTLMATYACNQCGMSVNASCAKCDIPLENGHLSLDEGSEVQVSLCTS